VDVVLAPLPCSDESLLSQKLSLQRVCENFVCTEHGSFSTGLVLVKIVYDKNKAVSVSVRVSCRAQSNQTANQHPSRSKYYIYQTFLDQCVHLLPSGKCCRELSRNYGYNLTEGIIRLFPTRTRRHKKNSLRDYTQPLVSSESQYVMQRALNPFIMCRVRCECHQNEC